jgi:hypothetical protein
VTVVIVVVLFGGVVVALAVEAHPPSARCNDWQAQIGWEAGDRARRGPPPDAAASPSQSVRDAWAAWVGVLRGSKTFNGQDGEVKRPSGC